jgi:hypothetical protein
LNKDEHLNFMRREQKVISKCGLVVAWVCCEGVFFIESCVLDVYVAYSFMIFKYDLLNANDELKN